VRGSGKRTAYNRAKEGRPTIERRRGQPTEYTENTELQKIEIDAAGIKTRRRHRRRQESASDSHGFLAPVTAIPAHCSFLFSASFGSRSLYLGPFSFRVFRVFRRPSLPRLARRFLPTEHAEDTEGGLGKTFGSICAYAGTEDRAPPALTRENNATPTEQTEDREGCLVLAASTSSVPRERPEQAREARLPPRPAGRRG
jgi:hypothetical protein